MKLKRSIERKIVKQTLHCDFRANKSGMARRLLLVCARRWRTTDRERNARLNLPNGWRPTSTAVISSRTRTFHLLLIIAEIYTWRKEEKKRNNSESKSYNCQLSRQEIYALSGQLTSNLVHWRRVLWSMKLKRCSSVDDLQGSRDNSEEGAAAAASVVALFSFACQARSIASSPSGNH